MAAVGGGIVRLAEWRRVRDFVTDVPARAQPGVLAVLGEAGAGKSTLWRAGVEESVDAGQRVLRCEPTASEADMSFAGLLTCWPGCCLRWQPTSLARSGMRWRFPCCCGLRG